MQTRTKKLNSPLNKKLFQSPTGISENLPRKINHRRENNIQKLEIDRENVLINTDSGSQEHNSDHFQ